MKKIIALTDYKDRFGSKHFDEPYRSGMDKKKLKLYFSKLGYEIEYQMFSKITNGIQSPDINSYYIYTSSEDNSYYYKNYIEDVVLYLETIGADVMPKYRFLRANNNKVFMELLRNSTCDEEILSVKSNCYGVIEDIIPDLDKFNYPVVVKTAEGASGSGVFMAETKKKLLKISNSISSSKNIILDFRDFARYLKHKGYQRESKYRKKFIVQNMIQSLQNDWKIYYFGDKYYIFYRPILKKRGFRASGGGYDNYLYGENAPKPDGLFNFAKKIIQYFDVPHASIDIAFDGENFHLIEIQFLYFGTAGIPYSNGYYIDNNSKWDFIKEKLTIENVYANSIVRFIEGHL